jgi:hypothetical protein
MPPVLLAFSGRILQRGLPFGPFVFYPEENTHSHTACYFGIFRRLRAALFQDGLETPRSRSSWGPANASGACPKLSLLIATEINLKVGTPTTESERTLGIEALHCSIRRST